MPALPTPITSRANARVKALRQAFSGTAAQPEDLVGIEGATLMGEAHRSGLRFDTIFFRKRADDLVSYDAISHLQPRDVLVLNPEVFDSVVNTTSPHSIAATVKIPPHREPAASPKGCLLVLEDIQDPGNLGTLLRSAEAFGVQEIYLTPGCANPWNPKAIRASAGSVFRSPVQRAAIADALQRLRKLQVPIAAAVAGAGNATPSPLAHLLHPVAILIGNEGAGLSHQALALASERVHIPCATESLNAAVAGSLLLYEVQRQNIQRQQQRNGKEVL